MRLISQDGTIDVPYERVAVVVTGNYIGAEMDSKRYAMATYSCEEKVDKVMEMLYEAYTGVLPAVIVSGDDFPAEDIQTIIKSKQSFVRVFDKDDFKIEMLPRMFEFPADDEVEV